MSSISRRQPKVSIGLPVYNGERYLRSAIESILAQSLGDFELIISDNASTDETETICRKFMALDKRIRYHRNAQNMGAAANFNQCFELASGEYFKWAAHDDICSPDFLSKCIDVLEKDSSVVLCSTEVTFIDENGKIIRTHDSNLKNPNSPQVYIRFADLTSISHWCFDIFGVIKSDALRKTALIASYVGSDRNTLVVLGLLGRFHRIPEYLFFSRDHKERSIRKYPQPISRTKWFDPGVGCRVVFPHWRIFLEYIKSVGRVDLPVKQQALCYLHLLRWLKLNSRRMKTDVIVALKETARNFGPRQKSCRTLREVDNDKI